MIFKDKTVIVTGGSEGVGAAAARLFAQAGANLMLVARNRNLSQLPHLPVLLILMMTFRSRVCLFVL